MDIDKLLTHYIAEPIPIFLQQSHACFVPPLHQQISNPEKLLSIGSKTIFRRRKDGVLIEVAQVKSISKH